MSTTVSARFVIRRGTAAALASVNEVPLLGEFVYETDQGLVDGHYKIKIGDGVTHYNALPYLALGSGGSSGGVNNQTGTAYTFALGDDGYTVVATNASNIALTIPNDSTTNFVIGAKVAYTQGGAGQITVTGATGVTVRAPNGNTTGKLFDGGVAEKIAANTWQLWNGPALATVATTGDYNDLINKPANNVVNEQTTSYTLAATDANKVIRVTASAGTSVTIPPNGTVPLAIGSTVAIMQGGSSAVTFAAGSGVTFETPFGAATNGVGDSRVAFQRALNTWVIS